MSPTEPFLRRAAVTFKPLAAAAKRVLAEREARAAFAHPDRPPILVYQMGKVGSSTIYRALQQAALPNRVLHLHFLSDDLVKYREFQLKAGNYPLPYHIYLGESVQRIIRKKSQISCKIISLVRDPIAFVVSNLFHNPQFAQENLLDRSGMMDVAKTGQYLTNILEKENTFDYVYNWFDRELKTVFDIDVFSRPFPREDGYAVYHHNTVAALIIRLEDLSNKGSEVLTRFLATPQVIRLEAQNTRAESRYGYVYLSLLHTIKIESSVCRRIYSHKFSRHFYDDDMIERFVERWSK